MKLFYREKNRVALTEAGEVLYRHAKKILACYEEAERAVGKISGIVQGRILVGASTTMGEYILPRLLGQLKERYPRLEPLLMIGNSDRILNGVVRRTLDVGILADLAVGARFIATIENNQFQDVNYSGIYLRMQPGASSELGVSILTNTITRSGRGGAGDALVIRNADRTEVNRIQYLVTGEANVSRSLDRNTELQISLSKHDYKPGESVEVAIRAPYAGSGLITIERDKVYAQAWFHADTTSSVQRITVPAGFEGNGYINVQYIRDPSSDEIFMSPLSYGVVPFSVNMDARRNVLKVDAPALVKPGETVNFDVHSTRPGKVVVFAVDEAILPVAHYKLRRASGRARG